MTNDKMIQFLKRWRQLETQQRDLEFARSEWARDVRGEFVAGKAGDEQFAEWCSTELGLSRGQVYGDLLMRVSAIALVPDEKTWKVVGGLKAIAQVRDLPRREVLAVIECVKVTGKSVRTVMRERRGDATPIRSRQPIGSPLGTKTAERADLEALAAYIARTGKNVPHDIVLIVARYTMKSTARLKAA